MSRLAKDFLADHVGLESKVPRTLWALISRPGFLTAEYLAGRRVRWLLPLKLYLSVSVVYFLLLSLPLFGSLDRNVRYTASDRAAIDSAVGRGKVVTAGATIGDSLSRSTEGGLSGIIERRAGRFSNMDPAEQAEFFKGAFARYMPNAVFILLPLFAGLLYLLYRKTGRFFAEHLIFSLHFHAFAFVALIFGLVIPESLDIVVVLWILAYLFLSLRVVYGESKGRTVRKLFGLLIPYSAILLMVTMGVLLAIFTIG